MDKKNPKPNVHCTIHFVVVLQTIFDVILFFMKAGSYSIEAIYCQKFVLFGIHRLDGLGLSQDH